MILDAGDQILLCYAKVEILISVASVLSPGLAATDHRVRAWPQFCCFVGVVPGRP